MSGKFSDFIFPFVRQALWNECHSVDSSVSVRYGRIINSALFACK